MPKYNVTQFADMIASCNTVDSTVNVDNFINLIEEAIQKYINNLERDNTHHISVKIGQFNNKTQAISNPQKRLLDEIYNSWNIEYEIEPNSYVPSGYLEFLVLKPKK